MTYELKDNTIVQYHVRYKVASLNDEVWDWRAFPNPQKAWDSFYEYPPRVAGARDPVLIETTVSIKEKLA